MSQRKITCTFCGKTINLDYYSMDKALVKKMRDRQICFDCAFWEEIVKHPKPGTVIISGKLCLIKIIEHPNAWQRKKPGMIFAMNPVTHDTIASTGCQVIGTIPPHFKQYLPDQYKFITREIYERAMKYEGTICWSKGCWDRYHCIWYDKDKAEPNGPWNKIPDTHIVGNEMCESFINKDIFYDTSITINSDH